MKKLLNPMLFVLTFLLFLKFNGYSQGYTSIKVDREKVKNKGDENILNITRHKIANIKVMRTFIRMFGNATNITWAKDDRNSDLVYFEEDGKVIRAGFSKNGMFLYSFSFYGKELLPLEILEIVKENYRKRNITIVKEINVAGKIAYVISLEDRLSWLSIKILDGEITEDPIIPKQ